MTDMDVQLKYQNKQGNWDHLYPRTKARLVTDEKGQRLDELAKQVTQAHEEIIAGAVDGAAIRENVEERYKTLESTYANRLLSTEQQLAETDGRLDTILVNGTPTEGNTMLLDGAVAHDGTNHGSVGTNIRNTQTELKNLENKSLIKMQLPAYKFETGKWVNNGIITATSGYKITYHDVTNLDSVLVSGRAKPNRDLLAIYGPDGTHLSSVRNTTDADVTHTDLLVDVSAAGYVILSTYDDDNTALSKIHSLVGAKKLQETYSAHSIYDKKINPSNTESGFLYQKGVKNTLTSGKIYYYDLAGIEKIRVAGVNATNRDFLTFLNETNEAVDFYFNKLSNPLDFEIDVSQYEKLAISDDIYKSSPPFTVYKKSGLRDFLQGSEEGGGSITYSGELMRWVRIEKGGYQNTTLWNSTNVLMRVYDVSELDEVRIKSRTGANLNTYTLFKDGVIVGYSFNNTGSTLDYDSILDVTGADEVWLTMRNNDETIDSACYYVQEDDIPEKWKGQKFLWLGTSIPAHGAFGENRMNAYPQIVGGLLGASVRNHANGESLIAAKNPALISTANPYGFVNDFRKASRCLTNTVTEMQWVIDNFNSGVFTVNVPASIDSATAEGIRQRSYERRILPYLDDTDLIVFDHGHNDFGNTGTHKYEDLVTSYGTKNKYSYIGGMNFLMDLIKTRNPHIEVVQIADYSYKLPYVIEMQEKWAKLWNIPFFRLCDFSGLSQMTIQTTGYWNSDGYWVNSGGAEKTMTIQQTWLPDDIHPHSDKSGRASWHLATLVRDFLLYQA